MSSVGVETTEQKRERAKGRRRNRSGRQTALELHLSPYMRARVHETIDATPLRALDIFHLFSLGDRGIRREGFRRYVWRYRRRAALRGAGVPKSAGDEINRIATATYALLKSLSRDALTVGAVLMRLNDLDHAVNHPALNLGVAPMPSGGLSVLEAATTMGVSIRRVQQLCARQWCHQGLARKSKGQWVIHPEADTGQRGDVPAHSALGQIESL